MKLISWNVQWCRGCDGRVDPARIARVAREMADFDVLCLQEVASNYTDLAGSSGEDQYAALAGLFPRYTVEVVLDTRSGPLRVTTTHLEYYSARQRAAQVEALRELQIEAAGHATSRA